MRSRARAIAITMRYEVDIVTNVMEPSTIFRDEVLRHARRERKSARARERVERPRLTLYNRQAEFIVAPFESHAKPKKSVAVYYYLPSRAV